MRQKRFYSWETVIIGLFLLAWIVVIGAASVLVAIGLARGGDLPPWEAIIAWAIVIGPFIAIIVFSLACGAAVWLGLRWLLVRKSRLDYFIVKSIVLLLGIMTTNVIFVVVLGITLGKYIA